MLRISDHWTRFSLAILAISAGWMAWTSIFAPATTGGRTPAPQQGFLAPDFELATLQGEKISLGQFAGRPVLVNIWASWCPPCKAEMPDMQRIHAEYEALGLVILAVNATNQDSPRAAADFATQQGLTFPILMDTDGSVTRKYAVQALPSSFFIGRDGTIRRVMIGGPMSAAFLRAEVESLLQEAP
jgi:peroxiredoxin